MGQQGNALYCFTKAHFICKNAINTLENKKTQQKKHMVNTSHIPSYRVQPIAKKN